MPEVGVEQLQLRLAVQVRGEFAAHCDQRAGAAGRHVHAPQQLLPRRIGGPRERGRGFRRPVGEIALRCRAQCRFVRRKLRRKVALEAVPVVRIEGAQHVVQFARDLRAGRLAALRQQCRCEPLSSVKRRRMPTRMSATEQASPGATQGILTTDDPSRGFRMRQPVLR